MVTSSGLLICQVRRVEPNNSNVLYLILYFQFVNSLFSLHCRLFSFAGNTEIIATGCVYLHISNSKHNQLCLYQPCTELL